MHLLSGTRGQVNTVSAFSEHCVRGGEASAGSGLGVWHFGALADTEDATKAAQAETIQLLLLFGICWPSLADIKECVLMMQALYTPSLVGIVPIWIFPDTAGGGVSLLGVVAVLPVRLY